MAETLTTCDFWLASIGAGLLIVFAPVWIVVAFRSRLM